MNDRQFFRAQRQAQLKAFVDRLKLLVVPVPLNLPIAVPNAAKGFIHRRDPWAGPIRSFRMIKLPSVEVAQTEMGEIEIPQFPGSSLRRIAANSLPEESQLKSKPVAIRRFQISSVVPPFGLIARMIEVIARELVAIAWQSHAVLRGKGLQQQKRDSDTSEPTPHARPRRDSNAPRLEPGTAPQAQSRSTLPSAR